MALADLPLYSPVDAMQAQVVSIAIPFVANNPVVREVSASCDFIEYIGSDQSASIDVSVDKKSWTRLWPGQRLNGIRTTGYVYVRNPNSAAVRVYLRFGYGNFTNGDVVGISRDGRHPFSIGINKTDTTIALVSPSVIDVIPTVHKRRPHLKGVNVYNLGAAVAWLKFLWLANAAVPVPGVNQPRLQYPVPAHGSLYFDTTHGIGSDQALVAAADTETLYCWVTALDTVADNTAPGGAVCGIITVC